MSKKFKSQASSARATTAAFGNPSFGFGPTAPFQTSGSRLSYVTEQPDYSTISEPNVAVSFKNLSKKDSKTKEKALDDLNQYLSTLDGKASVDDAIIDAWSKIYPRVAVDNSRRVRQTAHKFQGSLAQLSGKRIAPRLPKIIGSWLAGTFDNDKAVSRAASDSLVRSFSTAEKRASLWQLYQKDIIEYVEDAATTQTSQTLSDERTVSHDDAEAKYVRVVTTAVLLFNALLSRGQYEDEKTSEEKSISLLSSENLWNHAYNPDPTVRRATYTLFSTCLVKAPNEISWSTIETAFIGKAMSVDQSGSASSYSESLLSIARLRPTAWVQHKSRSPVSKRLLKFVARGSQRGPASFWPTVSDLVKALPKEVWTTEIEDIPLPEGYTAQTATLVLNAFHKGCVNPEEPRQNLAAAWGALLDMTIWMSEQIIDRGDRDGLLQSYVLRPIRQYVLDETDMSQWTMPTSYAPSTSAQILNDMIAKFDYSNLLMFWSTISQHLMENVRTSQPEQSSKFKASQDQISGQSKRYCDLENRILSICPVEEQQRLAEDVFRQPNGLLFDSALEVLVNRNGKPYGAASLVHDLVITIPASALPSPPESASTTVLDFLQSNTPLLLDSPSSEILVSLLMKFRDDSATSQRANDVVAKIFSQVDINFSSPAVRTFLSKMTNDDWAQYPRMKDAAMQHVDDCLGGKDGSWATIVQLVQNLEPHSSITNEIFSRMSDALTEAHMSASAISGFEAILGSSTGSSKQVVPTDRLSTLLSRLLVVEESSVDTDTLAVYTLAERIKNDLAIVGVASDFSIDIVRRQLYTIGDEALSIHTVVDMAREAFSNAKPHERTKFRAVFPDESQWRKATEMFFRKCPSKSLSITSTLQGAALLVDPTGMSPEEFVDRQGYTLAVRLAIFTIRLAKSTDILEYIDTADRNAFLLKFPLILQIINEKLDISNENNIWKAESQETEDEMFDLVADGRHLVGDILSQELSSEVLESIPSGSTMESMWLKQLAAVNDQSALSFRLAVSFSDILSVCVEKAGFHRYSKIWAAEIAALRTAHNLFRSAALIIVCKSGMPHSERLCTEFAVDITGIKDDDKISSSKFEITVMILVTNPMQGIGRTTLLNLLVAGENPLLPGLPTQRVLYLVKSVVEYLHSGNNRTEECITESLKLLTAAIPCVAEMYDDFWEMLWIYFEQLLGTAWTTPSTIPLLHAALRLYAVYDRLARAITNDDLAEIWGRAVPELPSRFMEVLDQYNSSASAFDDAENVAEYNPEVLGLFHGRIRPRSLTFGLLGRAMAGMPVDDLPNMQDRYSLLVSEDREFQSTIFDVLHRYVIDSQEQKSLDVALSKESARLPEELLSLLLDAPSTESLQNSNQLNEILWSSPRQYLLAWKLVFDHFTKASHRLREMYAEDIRSTGHLTSLLPFIIDLLKVSSSKPVDLSKISIDHFNFDQLRSEPYSSEAQVIAAHLYYLCLLYLPNLTRSWWFESRNKVKGSLETFTEKQITPKLSRAALDSVSDWIKTLDTASDDGHSLEIKISSNASELIASIAVDEESAPVSLAISLPSAYPLQQALVTSRHRVAVSEKNWQSWLRTIRGIIMFSNGSLIDGLLAFRRNVQGALRGQTECSICYSIISTDMKTPDKTCGTCKNRFHGACLLRWFRSSNSSSCPLCRNNFNYA